MNDQNRRSNAIDRSGLTLVEVLCATALAGSLLGSVIVAQGAHLRQIRAAQQQHEAIRQLDRVLERWSAGRDSFPNDGDHAVPEAADWVCRLRRRETAETRLIQVQILRAEMWEVNVQQRHTQPAAWVELLIPAAPERR